jgi:hypothetical protein
VTSAICLEGGLTELPCLPDTLCNELDQERKARYAIQQKLKGVNPETKIRDRQTDRQTDRLRESQGWLYYWVGG